eukprot:XP_016662078.1 PREDICTED: uncharacterized protein LOC107884463 [Acyrthosiphon pisum]
MVRILNDTDEVREDDGTSSGSDLDEIESPISGDTDYLTESQLNTIILEGEDFSDFSADDLQNEIVAAMSYNEQDPLTQCVRCSAHTLQLCIDNGLKVVNGKIFVSLIYL